MLQFLNPIWLVAAGAVLVPVIIHLWNIRKGRVLRVGSTLLMAEATQKAATSLRVSEWLLLVLRCLLIITASLILAGAVWQTNKRDSKGWVLIERENLKAIYNKHQKSIDSLQKAGFEIRAFRPDFPSFQISDTTIADTSLTAETYWSLIRQLDYKLPAGYPVFVFTGDQLKKLVNHTAPMPKPTVSIDLHWLLTPQITSTAEVALDARQLANGKYASLVMHTTEDGSYLRNRVIASPANADTSTNRVAVVFEEKYQQDARFLEAALKAIAAFGKYKMEITVTTNQSNLNSPLNWLFWLSDKTLSGSTARNNFVYMPGKPVNTKSWLREDDGATPGSIETYQLIRDTLSENFVAKWRDGFGNPVLTHDQHNAIYRFYSRFDPNWTDLPWHPQFPKKLLQLILPEPAVADGRTFTLADALPVVTKETIKDKTALQGVVGLQKFLWLIAFLLFATERVISLNKTNPPKL